MAPPFLPSAPQTAALVAAPRGHSLQLTKGCSRTRRAKIACGMPIRHFSCFRADDPYCLLVTRMWTWAKFFGVPIVKLFE